MVDRSSRARRSLPALVVASAVLLAAQAARADTGLPTLYVNYTMSCTFVLTDESGTTLTSVAPGSYQILVTSPVPFAAVDLGGVNDMTACKGSARFALTGPGVSVTTTLDNGDSDHALLDVTLAPSSTYTAVDNTQPALAHVSFTTTASGTASPVSGATVATTTATQTEATAGSSASTASKPPAPPSALPDRGTLAATVTASGAVALTYRGRAVTALRAGRYTITVTDESRRSGFAIEQTHGATTVLSTGLFAGKRSTPIDLSAGRWSFFATPARGRTFFSVRP